MQLELVQLLSTDQLKLPGLLYTPDEPSKRAAIWLHGMGDDEVFYKPARTNALGAALSEKGIAFLAFDNRGAHNAKSLKIANQPADANDTFQGGVHYELITDCVADIDGAVAFLKDKGYSELYLLGHSTGANKICVYNAATSDNPFSKYVLAGPGDDCGLFYNELGPEQFKDSLETAQAMIEAGDSLDVMPEASGMYPFSAQSTYDILNPNGDYNTFPFYEQNTARIGDKPLFGAYQQINIPTLVVFGEHDEYTYTAGTTSDALIMFEDHTNEAIVDDCGFLVIPGATHSFRGSEVAFAEAVASWLNGEAT